MSGDRLTVLRSNSRRLCKVWKTDGTMQPYDNAKWFSIEQRDVDGIQALAVLLQTLERDPYVCIVRGTPKPSTEPLIRRLLENFDDIPLHTVLIEIDEYRPVINDPLVEPMDAALEFIAECLPEAFQNVSFAWQSSNSMGAPGKEGLLKMHLWMYLETPYDSATLRAWAKHLNLAIDISVLQPVQPHFVAAPIFEAGRIDPVAQRSGLWRGDRDSVPLVIDTENLAIRIQDSRQRGERRDIDDPIADWLEGNWEVWGGLDNGGLLVSCPFEDEHTNARMEGDTSTAYFPAGTNNYSTGSWVCLHGHCRDKSRDEFLHAAGYMDTRLASLAAEPLTQGLPARINGHRLNGHGLNDPLVLPPFKRNRGGTILCSMENVVMGAAAPQVTGFALRYDTFKDGLVCEDVTEGKWRPFNDTDYTDLRIKFEQRGFPPISKDMMRDAVHLAARQDSFDTAQEWLGGLEWDGIPRIEQFWIEHFGVLDDPAGYARAVGRYTWTALAGRVLAPGCQADMAPILTGPQGIGKSRGIAAIAPARDFATSMSFNEPEVERARKMRGTLIVELAELQGLKTRDREEILAWVTRSDEHWTPKFMEMTTTFKRRFLMCGTTNLNDFLDDPTGERRWLPMQVGQAPGFSGVDVSGIEGAREQLWAEGRELFLKSGIQWRDAERLARGEHHNYKAEDIWHDAVLRWLNTPDMAGETPRKRPYLTVREVAEGALSIPAKQVRWVEQRRISKLLREEGYDLAVRRVEGRSTKVWAPLDFV